MFLNFVCFQGIGKLSMVAQSATKEITAKVICIIDVFIVNCDPYFL
jgi:vancomycin permeability regulator SanA